MVDDHAQGSDSKPVAWRVRWKVGSERDREWEMWSYRNEEPAPNEHQTIEPLYAAPLAEGPNASRGYADEMPLTARAAKIIGDAAGSSQEDWSKYDHAMLDLAREADLTIADIRLLSPAECDWQPIETAPKDRFILLYCQEDNSRWMAKWQGGEWYGMDCEHGIRRTGHSLGDPNYVTGWFVSEWREIPEFGFDHAKRRSQPVIDNKDPSNG